MKKAFCQQTDSLLALSRSNSKKGKNYEPFSQGKFSRRGFYFLLVKNHTRPSKVAGVLYKDFYFLLIWDYNYNLDCRKR